MSELTIYEYKHNIPKKVMERLAFLASMHYSAPSGHFGPGTSARVIFEFFGEDAGTRLGFAKDILRQHHYVEI
jgi:hypothetical protein